MPFNTTRARELLQNFDFRPLFIMLGWDRHETLLEVVVAGDSLTLNAIAQKRGMVLYHYPAPDGEPMPDSSRRRKIEHQVARSVREHLIVFTDGANTTQIWQWVKREPGKPLACREHTFHASQSGDSLLQKFQGITFTLEEEEKLSLPEVTGRARAAFDVERVTKRFYDRFQKEHSAFLDFITGITEQGDHEWYASVMLNRLMFVYFVQRKGFLDGNPDYLRDRLTRMRADRGQDKFYSFYRYFLLRLFHEGLGGRDRSPDLEKLIGKIPYLNGGLFDVHELEREDRYGTTIQIPDEAFERVFDFFDQYQWHLDERPNKDDTEINPEVLGYIFEKYINNKQMGAYYTKEDITGYISKNTVIPFLFDAARAKCKIAFENPKGSTVWNLLQDDPDRYIYEAVRHGITWDVHWDKALEEPVELPDEIAKGLNPPTLHQPVGEGPVQTLELRKGWNKAAPAEYALPTEIWREVIARRNRYEEIHQKLAAGEVQDINDLITLNLDVRQFARDVIENCEGPDLLRAFWRAIEKITVLDPTCGSGAFLFAALNILEPLYEACLERMQGFVDDLERSGEKHHPEKFSDFRKILASVAAHPNHRYFVLKSIILNNLYGVDIMEEAVEICKLRLFLKLAAQVEPDTAGHNLGIEPLPDIDFNIRAGNTLVGYATEDEVRRLFTEDQGGQSRLMFGQDTTAYERFEEQVELADHAFRQFREMQTERGMDADAFTGAKATLRERLQAMEAELNRHLGKEYGVNTNNEATYAKWVKSHQPFHWFVEFYGIMNAGGFDVIIGNPPYIELRALNDYKLSGFSCERSGNLYALVIERCAQIGLQSGWQGYIVPVSSVSTDRYDTLQQLLARREDHFSSFDDRPSRLFDGLEHIRLTIHILGRHTNQPKFLSTRYNKWVREERTVLFDKLIFAKSTRTLVKNTLPKFCSDLEQSINQKLLNQHHQMSEFYSRSNQHPVYYSRKVGYFLQVLDFEPRVLDGRGVRRPPSEFKELKFRSKEHSKLALCCLNSNLFYWFITVFSDCRHMNKREVDAFPVNLDTLASSGVRETLLKLSVSLMNSLQSNSMNREMRFRHDTLTVQCIYPKASKQLLDKIDQSIAIHYGFTEEELDSIINYDIKYRMGLGRGSEAE